MKRTLACLSLLSLSLTLVGCTASTNTDGPLKLGVIAPLTGDAAALGTDMTNGVRMAADEFNKAGGVGGRMVEVVAEDGKCTGSDAAGAAQKLVNVDKVVAVVGGLCSGETLAAAPIAEAGKVVLMSPGSSSPAVSKAGDFVFRDYPSDALKTKAMAQYFAEKGYKKVAMISENTDFAQAFRASLKANLPADAIAFDEVVEPGTKDFRTLLTRMKDAKFDVFFPDAQSDGVMAVLLQQYREQGFTQLALSHDVADSAVIDQVAGKAADGFLLINVPNSGEGGSFEKAFQTAYGAPQASIAWAAHAYDAANVLFAVMKDKGTDGTAMKDALYALPSYKGVVGEFHFDESGDVLGIPYVLKEHRGGKIVKLQDIRVK